MAVEHVVQLGLEIIGPSLPFFLATFFGYGVFAPRQEDIDASEHKASEKIRVEVEAQRQAAKRQAAQWAEQKRRREQRAVLAKLDRNGW